MRLKKILILAYDFPPLISIAAQRPYSWYKYLPDQDFFVTVVTRHWVEHINTSQDYIRATKQNVASEILPQKEIMRVAFAPNLRDRLLLKFGEQKFTLIRKMLSFIYSLGEHISFQFDSKAQIYFQAQKILRHSNYDLIIATGEPFILFKYAHLLSIEFRIPWMADYRDGWTTNQGNYRHGVLAKLQHTFFRRKEKKYISNSSLIITAAPDYAAALQKIHPTKRIEVVYNGFDEDAMKGTESLQPGKTTFIISYVGTIYPHQNLEMFLQGLALFLKNRNIEHSPNLEVRFYGLQSQQEAINRVKNFTELSTVIKVLPKIPYPELLKELKQSHLLLLLSANKAQWLNAKLFDYLAVERPILLVENDHGVMEQLIEKNNAGIAVETVDQVAAFISAQYSEFLNNTPSPIISNADRKCYSRREQTKILTQLINNTFCHE